VVSIDVILQWQSSMSVVSVRFKLDEVGEILSFNPGIFHIELEIPLHVIIIYKTRVWMTARYASTSKLQFSFSVPLSPTHCDSFMSGSRV
jgi:hypothetical protein